MADDDTASGKGQARGARTPRRRRGGATAVTGTGVAPVEAAETPVAGDGDTAADDGYTAADDGYTTAGGSATALVETTADAAVSAGSLGIDEPVEAIEPADGDLVVDDDLVAAEQDRALAAEAGEPDADPVEDALAADDDLEADEDLVADDDVVAGEDLAAGTSVRPTRRRTTTGDLLVEGDPTGEELTTDLAEPGAYEVADDEFEAEELEDDSEIPDAEEQTAEAEVVARKASSTRPVKKARPETAEAAGARTPKKTATPVTKSTAPVKKTAATRRRDEATAVRPKRTGPVQFVRESIHELREVVWPTRSQLGQYFLVVLVFVLFIIGLVFGLDYLFGWLLLKLLG